MYKRQQEDIKVLIARDWRFKEKPQTNLSNFMGHVENRTVFDGSEIISFKSDSSFLVNQIKYGKWILNRTDSLIEITQISNNEYTCCGIGQTTMGWEIKVVTKDEMTVNHRYYRFLENVYKLK